MKVSILIPAYNESNQIGKLMRELKSMGFDPVVVDDGSQDATASKARDNGAEVFRHERNLGKGASLKTGLTHVLRKDYDAVIIMDGDAQHSPDDISKFIDVASKNRNAMIVGNRMGNAENMPLDRKLTNRLMSFLVSRVCGQFIPDTQCGFRLIRRDLLKKITIESSRFEVESEILIKASGAGAKIISLPIKTLYGKEASQIKPFWDTFRFIIFLLKLPFSK